MTVSCKRGALVRAASLRVIVRRGNLRREILVLQVAAAISALGAVGAPASAQSSSIPLNGQTYRQDFNSLPTTGTANTAASLPIGFAFSEAGTGGTLTFTADNGTLVIGNTYSYGTAGNAERAFGEITSGTVASTLGARFLNDTGFVITAISVGYTGEMWRLGAADAIVDRLDFQYSTNATSIVDNSAGVVWTDVNALDFTSPNNTAPAGAKDGNLAANRTVLPLTPIVLSQLVPHGQSFFIRWLPIAAIGGTNDGLAIDDLLVTYSPSADFDGDGDVDGSDFLNLQRGLGTLAGASAANGDANRDGAVDAIDRVIWTGQFGATAAAVPAFIAAPEPTCGVLGALAGLGGARGARRRACGAKNEAAG